MARKVVESIKETKILLRKADWERKGEVALQTPVVAAQLLPLTVQSIEMISYLLPQAVNSHSLDLIDFPIMPKRGGNRVSMS